MLHQCALSMHVCVVNECVTLPLCEHGRCVTALHMAAGAILTAHIIWEGHLYGAGVWTGMPTESHALKVHTELIQQVAI